MCREIFSNVPSQKKVRQPIRDLLLVNLAYNRHGQSGRWDLDLDEDPGSVLVLREIL